LTEALNSKQLGAINEELEKFKLLDKEIGQYWNQVNKSLLESVLKEEEIQKAKKELQTKITVLRAMVKTARGKRRYKADDGE